MDEESSQKNEEKLSILKATTNDTERRLDHKPQEVKFVRELKWKFHFPGEQKEKSDEPNSASTRRDQDFYRTVFLEDELFDEKKLERENTSTFPQEEIDEDQNGVELSPHYVTDDERKDSGFASEDESLKEVSMQRSITNDGEENYDFISEESRNEFQYGDFENNWEEIDEGIRNTASENPDASSGQGSDNEIEVDENSDLGKPHDLSNEEFFYDEILINSQQPNPNFELDEKNRDTELQSCVIGINDMTPEDFVKENKESPFIPKDVQNTHREKVSNNPIDENIVKADSSETTEVCRHRYINKDSKANNKKTNIAASCFLVLGALSATIALSLGLYKGHFGIVECILFIIVIVSVCTAALIKSYSKVKSYLSEAKSDTIDPLTMVQN